MPAQLQAVLMNLVAAGLALGLAAAAAVWRPAPGLRGPLVAFDLGVLCYVMGDAVRRLAPDADGQALGMLLVHTGTLPTAAACWLLALRYAQVQGGTLAPRRAIWARAPVALAAVAWVVAVARVWRGSGPAFGREAATAGEPGLSLALVAVAGGLTAGAVALLARLARRVDDASVRRNALAMAAGIAITLFFGALDSLLPRPLPVDLAVLGLCGTMLIFLFEAYRVRLFHLLPVATREVLRHTRDGVVVASPRGRLLYANPAALALLDVGVPPSEPSLFALLGARLRDERGGPLDGRELVDRLLREPGGPGEAVVRTAAGERWLRVHPTAIPGRGGAIAAISLQLTDVTESQRAAAALVRARDELERRVAERTAALRASEERYRLVSELSSDTSFGIWVRPGGAVEREWLTRGIERLTGYTAEELDALGWIGRLHPEDRQRIGQAAGVLREGGVWNLECRVLARSGETRWLELHLRAIERAADGSLRLVGAVRDISERRRAEDERHALELRGQESQRLESLGELAGGIAHDFNNVISIVLGNATLALQDLPPESRARSRLERIRAAGEYATQLTEQVLTYAGRSRPKLAALDVSRVVGDIADLLEASARPCPLELDLAAALPAVEGDQTQLRQVLMNLVTNARDASPEAGAPIRVRARALRAERAWLDASLGGAGLPAGDYVAVEIRDHGVGMDATTRARIFEPFYTTRTAGRGLGLAVVLGIVRGHGGAIHLETAPGEGSTFCVVLPPSSARGARAAGGAGAASGGGAETVLVCEDDPGVLELATLFLGRAGFRVLGAATAAEARARLGGEADALAAVVLDLRLPDADAGELLRVFADRRPDLPVIVATGHDEERARDALRGATPAGWLRKPYTAEALVAAVREALAGGRA
jgi:PAS domain S-box-containing protein